MEYNYRLICILPDYSNFLEGFGKSISDVSVEIGFSSSFSTDTSKCSLIDI